MSEGTSASVRLYATLARAAPAAVVFRLGFDREGKKGKLLPPDAARTLIDLSERKFEPREAPAAATDWRGPV